MVVADPKMVAIIESARTVARHDAAVLITGETGCGKEVVARTIHEHSARCNRPWIDLNCAALPEHLVESELFGYEKGAFSGANSAKCGLFELANGGTLFLDEIGDLDLKVQVKLLRVLDGNPYYRLGGNRKVTVDVRVVAATNRDLESSVREGSFRSDLYHRISELHLKVPPLRERPDDIIALARHFLQRRRPEAAFTPEALDFLRQHEWRGNVRELRNTILKLAVLSSAQEIAPKDIQPYLTAPEKTDTEVAAAPQPPEVISIAEMERQMIVRALELSRGNQSLAAEHLGMPRRTFCRKLNQFQINVERRRHSAAKQESASALNRRKELSVPVSLTTKAGQRLEATARNLSAGGLGLQGLESPLPISDELTLQFTLPGTTERLEMNGVVAWSEANGTAGIRFAGVSESRMAILQRWLAGNRIFPVATNALRPLERDRTATAHASCI